MILKEGRNKNMDKEKNIVGKNLLEGTYFDGNGIPKMIGITKAEYLEYKQLQQENKQLQERIEYLERSNNHREDTILEQRQRLNDLEDNWNKLKEWVKNNIKYWEKEEKNWIEMGIAKVGGEANNKIIFKMILDIVEELEQGSDSK